MTVPAPTERGEPGGFALPKGFQSLITNELNTTIKFWEKEVTPSGADVGDKIDTSTMHNVRYKTAEPPCLIDITDGQTTVAYDPAVETEIYAILGINTTITYTFSDGSTKALFGYFKSFTPDGMTPDGQPQATVIVVATNVDPDSFDEEGPVIADVAGTP
jgi:hypothetical protein